MFKLKLCFFYWEINGFNKINYQMNRVILMSSILFYEFHKSSLFRKQLYKAITIRPKPTAKPDINKSET